jgi:hypothetical protein
MAFYEGRVFILSLRVIQAVLTILILGLTGYGKLPITANLVERSPLTNSHSGQLVEQLLACRTAVIGQLPPLLRGNHSNYSGLLDRGTDALLRNKAQPRRHHHRCGRPHHDLLVRWFRCARGLPQ